jgi:hypothetical protein
VSSASKPLAFQAGERDLRGAEKEWKALLCDGLARGSQPRFLAHLASRRRTALRNPPCTLIRTCLRTTGREGLERPCRYGARGALALALLSRAAEGPQLLPQAWAVPKPQEASPPPEAAANAEAKKERTPRLTWAGLLRRTFALDVFACMRCGGRRRVLAYVKGAGGVRAIVEHLGLPTASAHLAPAREPPQSAGC